MYVCMYRTYIGLDVSGGGSQAGAPGNTLVAVEHCSGEHCSALHCTALHCTALHCTALHCAQLHCTALQCTVLHFTALYFTALHIAREPLGQSEQFLIPFSGPGHRL
jgi:hypothetical protein